MNYKYMLSADAEHEAYSYLLKPLPAYNLRVIWPGKVTKIRWLPPGYR